MIATFALVTALISAPQNDRAQIDALCKQIALATQTKNWKKLTSLSTPDFKQTTGNGQVATLPQLTAAFEATLNRLSDRKCTYKILTLTSKGTTATGELYWSIFGTTTDPMGHKHKVELSDREEDTFKKIKGKWLEAKVVEQEDVQKLDGKIQTGSAGGNGV
jgi:hypothetical protein